MPMSFNRIAYERLDVCNGVEMPVIEAAILHTGLTPGSRAFDVGTGNAAVAIRLAERFGFQVTAIELDPVMADLARTRIDAAGVGPKVALVLASAASVLASAPPADLIVALGTTNVTGQGRPTPEAALAFMVEHLRPGGWLLWGDLVWLSEPPAPLRQIAEATNLYADDTGWRSAAATAGLEQVWSEISPQAVFDHYGTTAIGAAQDWLQEHADAPEAGTVRASTERIAAILDFGRPFIGFGLYLWRRPD